MRLALLPSTQWGNSVLGGGSEALYAQDIAGKLKALLSPYLAVEIFAGKKNSNSDGARAAVSWGADYCVSIHSDAGYIKKSHHAALGLYGRRRSEGYVKSILARYCQEMSFANRGVKYRPLGTAQGVSVLSIPERAGIPACLLEVTWHDRNPDASELRTNAWRQKCAIALAVAVGGYLGINIEEEEMPGIDRLKFGPTKRIEQEAGYVNGDRGKVHINIINPHEDRDIDVECLVHDQRGGWHQKAITGVPHKQADVLNMRTVELGEFLGDPGMGDVLIDLFSDDEFKAYIGQELR